MAFQQFRASYVDGPTLSHPHRLAKRVLVWYDTKSKAVPYPLVAAEDGLKRNDQVETGMRNGVAVDFVPFFPRGSLEG